METAENKKENKLKRMIAFAKEKPESFWAIFCLIILGLFILCSLIYNSYDISSKAYWISTTFDAGGETAVSKIDEFESDKEGKILYINFYKTKYEEFKKENDRIVKERADSISKGILDLEKYEKIDSQEIYDETVEKISELIIDDSTEYGKKLKSEVENYDDLIKYRDDFYELAETYKVVCGRCNGNGRLSCGYCGGSGKRGVTWYSEGDWGYSSYSSYDCKYCSGGRVDCSGCDSGYFLKFD